MSDFLAFTFECPVCGAEFQGEELHGARPIGWDTDFRPVYEGADPIFSHIHTCPRCRYSGYREAFEFRAPEEIEFYSVPPTDPLALPAPEAMLPDELELDALQRWTRSGELTEGLVDAETEPTGAVSYLLARNIHDFLVDEDPLGAAHFIQKAAWCARASGRDELERQALRDVLVLLEPLRDDPAISEAMRANLTFHVGEISRRLGDFGNAVSLLSSIEPEALEHEPGFGLLAPLAERQLLLAMSQVSLNARIPESLRPPPVGIRLSESSADDSDEEEGGGQAA